MSDAPGSGPMDTPRPDHEPTLNEAGAVVFGVDGTDSFAVPGPADGLPLHDAPEPPSISRTRLLVTVGAVVSGLVFVVAVGSGSGAEDPRLRTADGGGGSGFMNPFWGDDDDDGAEVVVVPLDPNDAETLRQLEETGPPTGTVDPYATDETYDDDALATYPTDPDDTIDFGADDDDFDFDDDDFSSNRPSFTVPRRTTPPRRNPIITAPRTTAPRVTTTTTTTTTTIPTTTTTTIPTTTSSSIAPTTPTTPPTTPTTLPAPAWARLTTAGLPATCAVLDVRATDRSLVARADAAWFRSTDSGASWLSVDARNRGEITAIADPAAAPADAFWFATATGVFDQAGTAVGDLAGVRSLTARVASNVTTLLAVTDGGLSRSEGGAWTPVEDPDLVGRVLGAVRLLPSGDALLGSDVGVLRSIDGGQSWTPATTPGGSVAGEPVVTPDGKVAWLLAGGSGAISSPNAGATWVATPGIGSAAALKSVSVLPSGGIAAVDTVGALVVADDTAWSAFAPSPGGTVAGVVRTASSTIVFRPVCGPESMLQLADAQP